MAAAHAGCFTMKLSLDLTEAGFNPESLETTSTITLDDGVITGSELVLKAKVSEIDEEQFQEIAAGAKENCPVSKAYGVINISLKATLEN
jgi:osmotically inducible protein OsmC